MSELPKDWKMGTLRDLARVRNGYAFKSSDFIDEGVPLIRQSNLVGDTVEIENAKCLPPSFLDEHPRFTVKKGDVLIGMSGSIGKLSWYRHDTPALQNQRTGLLEFEEPGSAGWVCYFLNSVERQLNQTAKGVAVQNISGKEIEALSLPLPSLSEQRRIVARIEELFSRLDAGVAALRHAKAQLQRYRQSVLAAAVTGKLTQAWREQKVAEASRLSSSPNDQRQDASATLPYEPAEELLERILEQRRETWSGKGKYKEPLPIAEGVFESLPTGWTLASLEGITDANRPICYGILMPKANLPDGVLYVKVRDMRGDKINLESLQRTAPEIAAKYERASLKEGDLLLSIRGTYGRLAIIPPELDGGNITQDSARLAVSKNLNRDYVAWAIRSHTLQTHFKKVARGVAVKGVNIGDVKPTPIPIPPLAEQYQIVAEVEARTTAIDHLEAELDRQITRSNRLRQSTLASAFSGIL